MATLRLTPRIVGVGCDHIHMTNVKDQVRKFYEQIWNQRRHEMIPDVLDEDVRFRGSLGSHHRGHSEFQEYLNQVHEALGEYRCIIDDLVCESNKAFARMTFTGIHRGTFMGYPPSGERITWAGAALFTFEQERVTDLWVLGDLMALESQLKGLQGSQTSGHITL